MNTVTIELHQSPAQGDLVTVLTPGEHPLTGVPCQVESVELPFVAAKVLSGAYEGRVATLDLRTLQMMRIGAHYVAACRGMTDKGQAHQSAGVPTP